MISPAFDGASVSHDSKEAPGTHFTRLRHRDGGGPSSNTNSQESLRALAKRYGITPKDGSSGGKAAAPLVTRRQAPGSLSPPSAFLGAFAPHPLPHFSDLRKSNPNSLAAPGSEMIVTELYAS